MREKAKKTKAFLARVDRIVNQVGAVVVGGDNDPLEAFVAVITVASLMAKICNYSDEDFVSICRKAITSDRVNQLSAEAIVASDLRAIQEKNHAKP
jgi:hypothetical protein